jgi:hypothetical protein
MHRSGTSLVASWLGACGLVTDNGKSFGPDVGNQYGHFEDAELANLQSKEILRQITRSKGWIVTNESALGQVSDMFLSEANNQVENRNAKYDSWAWKDPRSTLFLEEWDKIIPELKYLLLWRPCVEVVMSLVDRAGKTEKDVYKIGLLNAIRTWATYNRKLIAFQESHKEKCVMLQISSILESDKNAFEALETLLGYELQYKPIAELFNKEVFKSRPPSFLLKTLCTLLSTDDIEQRLRANSWSFDAYEGVR